MIAWLKSLFPMPHDVMPGNRKPRHRRGRPALVAPTDHAGATADWSPIADVTSVDLGEPEETLPEATEREAVQLVDHWAELKREAEKQTIAEFDALSPKLTPLLAAVEEACRAALESLGITEADVDEYAATQTASFDASELRRLIGAGA